MSRMNMPHRENRRVLRHKPEEERMNRHKPEGENQFEDPSIHPSNPPAREDKEAVAGRETDGEVCDWQPAAPLMIIKDLRSAQV